MGIRPLELEDRAKVRSLVLGNPYKADQIRAQKLDTEKLADFHTDRLMGRVGSAESPVFAYEAYGRLGLLGVSLATHHSSFFDKTVISIDPVLTYFLSNREKEEALYEMVPFLEPYNPQVVWARCDEEESGLVASLVRFGGEFCGTTVRMTRWLDPSIGSAKSEGIEIRLATMSDLPNLRHLSASSHQHSHFFRDPYLPSDKKRELFPHYMETCLGKSGRPCLVAVDKEGGLVGFSLLLCPTGQKEKIGRDIGIVDFIAVDPKAQGRGIGKILLLESLQVLAEKGYECVELKTMLENRQAIGFYQQFGFRMVSSDLQFSIGKGGSGGWS